MDGFFSFEGEKPVEIIYLDLESRIKVSFLGETRTLSLEVSDDFLIEKMRRSTEYMLLCKECERSHLHF